MKIKNTARGYEATVTFPIVHGTPSNAPAEDDSGESAGVWDDIGKQVLIWDKPTSTWKPVGGGGFGSDTTIPVPNSAAASKDILRLTASYTSNTAGAEVTQWLMKLYRAGIQENSYKFLAGQLVMDGAYLTGGLFFNYNGAATGASVTSDNNGTVSMTTGFLYGGTQFVVSGVAYARMLGTAAGGLLAKIPIQEVQFANIASASTLLLPFASVVDGGNGGIVTGTTTINLISSAGAAQRGYRIWLQNTSGLTYKHNQAPSGNGVAMKLVGSADVVAPAGSIMTFVFMGPDATGGTSWWQQLTPIVSP